MVTSIAVSWAVGLAFLIVLLFSIQDIDTIIHSTLDMPVAQLFYASLIFFLYVYIKRINPPRKQ